MESETESMLQAEEHSTKKCWYTYTCPKTRERSFKIESGWWLREKNRKTSRPPSDLVVQMDHIGDFGLKNEDEPNADLQKPPLRSVSRHADAGCHGEAGRQIVQEHEEDIYDNIASARYKVSLHKGDIPGLEKITKELCSNDVLDVGISFKPDRMATAKTPELCLWKSNLTDEKTEPKNKWSESSAKPILMPPKKVPPPVKVKPLLTNLNNRAGGEQMPQDLIKPARDLTSDSESVTFDSLTLPTEPLKHLTTERPRAQGRRPPSHSRTTAALDAKRSTPPLVAPKVTLPTIHVCEPAPAQRHQPTSERPVPPLPRSPMKAQRGAGKEERMDSIAWLKVELRQLQLSLNLLKNQHLNDMIEIKEEIAAERIKWTALQMEVENLRGMISL